ncbi:MAG: LssY C-terminal domain-containing protein [Acidobacteriia bacterium]|nr:LssY C-terminal domain-containing protein [Terriglobia bacterium]
MRLAALLLLSLPAWAQSITVSASQQWTDTSIDLRVGDAIVITAEGTLQLPQAKSCGPDGQPRGFRDLLKVYQVNDSGLGTLIGRIGSSDVALPFTIGARKEIQVRRGGRLFLGVNSGSNDSLDGQYTATVEFTKHGPENPAAVTYKLPTVTLGMIDRIPRRVVDADGNPGDNTNFVVVGKEDNVIDTFKAAGWVKVDKDTKEAFINGLVETLKKQSYVEMPMSVLTLFGRPQDYGLAHAEPISVVAQRNHLRLWKAPFKVEGQELWVGAATHDIGFDRDNRPGKKITHKIDPDIDLEREYVGRSLEETGSVAKKDYIMPSDPSKEAKTATGAGFHSDGRVMVIYLIPAS